MLWFYYGYIIIGNKNLQIMLSIFVLSIMF